MTTTAETVTTTQIRALRTKALSPAASDYDMAAICDLALDGAIDPDDYTTLSTRTSARLRTMTQEQAQAQAECARVISQAEAQS